ncbi:MAG TPA: DUF2625 domain-containing protein [Candidatus Acidoferrum sp.]|nr:DUF2625 domain-containing protein [Candidatus Acidoferrum sp.]
MCAKRSIEELLATEEPAWPMVQQWIQAAHNSVEVLPADEAAGREALLEAQVTLRSPMGAVVYHTGGILVDHGWLRLLGCGHPKLPRTMPEWNRGRSTDAAGTSLGFWLVADDAVGGFYALNGGAFGPGSGEVFYFGPDALHWEPMNGMNYSQFIVWSLSEALARFYSAMRWPGWEAEVSSLGGDRALSFYPFLWNKEGKDVAKCSRKPGPVEEVYSLNVVEFPKQLHALSKKS